MMNIERDNLIAECNFLRRAVFTAEANLRVAASIMRQTGNELEAREFEKNAAHCKTMRLIVASL